MQSNLTFSIDAILNRIGTNQFRGGSVSDDDNQDIKNVQPTINKPKYIDTCHQPHMHNKLWEFIMGLLADSRYQTIIKWDKNAPIGQFTFINQEKVAQMWGLRKGRTNMNFDKLSRCLRYYYGQMILTKVRGLRFSYIFHPSFVNVPYTCTQVHKPERKISRDQPRKVMPTVNHIDMDTDNNYIAFSPTAIQYGSPLFDSSRLCFLSMREPLKTKSPSFCGQNRKMPMSNNNIFIESETYGRYILPMSLHVDDEHDKEVCDINSSITRKC